MTEQTIFYLDDSSPFDSRYSDKKRSFYRIFFLLATVIILSAAAYQMITDFKSYQLLWIFYGLFWVALFAFKPLFHKKFGRKYITFDTADLHLKISYFKPEVTLSGEMIKKINFDGRTFIIDTDAEESGPIVFSAGLDAYEEVREKFYSWCSGNNIPVKD